MEVNTVLLVGAPGDLRAMIAVALSDVGHVAEIIYTDNAAQANDILAILGYGKFDLFVLDACDESSKALSVLSANPFISRQKVVWALIAQTDEFAKPRALALGARRVFKCHDDLLLIFEACSEFNH